VKEDGREFKIALLGFGNAGKAFAALLWDKLEEIRKNYRCSVLVTAIATGSRGCLINENGLDLTRALNEIQERGHFAAENPDASTFTSLEIAEKAVYDILIELTPLAIFSGQPAIDHIEAAFHRKKHVITANKGPIAWDFKRLRRLAESQGVKFCYETTVMDGTPVFNLVEDTLKLCRVTAVKGILNSTTNFILEELTKGRTYDEVIAEGKERGFVEADPSLDVEGWDAAAKTAALLNVLMDADITPDLIQRKGIEGITTKQLREADSNGKVIKLLCRGMIQNGAVVGSVGPEEIDKKELFASISGTSSVVTITTDLMGPVSVVEHDPEILQTAYGVLSDLIRVIA
jgi:homoserine dehydrogenase